YRVHRSRGGIIQVTAGRIRRVDAGQSSGLRGDVGLLQLRLLGRRTLEGARQSGLGDAQILIELAHALGELVFVQAEAQVELPNGLFEGLLITTGDRAQQRVDL